MESVRKLYFDPLLTSKLQVRQLVASLPPGSAHPYSPDRVLLCNAPNGVQEIDISSYDEEFFYNAVDLGEMGEILLKRMSKFSQLNQFGDYLITQASAATFRIPIVNDSITIMAVSQLYPTYYDFCFGDADMNTCCWTQQHTFPGISHSGDIIVNGDLLDYVKISANNLVKKEICVFISGYQKTPITKFLGTHPALLVADNVEKILYIIPVPLDSATIGDATICCPLVMKRDGQEIIFSILSKATTDRDMMCWTRTLATPAFKDAIERADFSPQRAATAQGLLPEGTEYIEEIANDDSAIQLSDSAVIKTANASIPPHVGLEEHQVITFGSGLTFAAEDSRLGDAAKASETVLPCVFGTPFSGPMILATGACPSNVPFKTVSALQEYYQGLKAAVVVVDDRMTDNARNLAPSYRLNAVFVVQPRDTPLSASGDEVVSQAVDASPVASGDDIVSKLNSININAVTALAGPQSLVLVQLENKYYFYRGIANRKHLRTATLDFGDDVTSVVESVGLASLLEPVSKRVCDLADDTNSITLPTSGQLIRPKDLADLLCTAIANGLEAMEEDIAAAVPQLQMLLDDKELISLSRSLVNALTAWAADRTKGPRTEYLDFIAKGWKMGDPDSVKQKGLLLGKLKTATREAQVLLEPAISKLSTLVSFKNSSKRTHDLKRLERQSKIQNNVEAVKEMTFEKLGEYLENHASDMGVMLLNVKQPAFKKLLSSLTKDTIENVNVGPSCALDSRVLYLEGFDAGIIMEQSQQNHNGPLCHQQGPSVPIMALPYLNQGAGSGSMLAWVCWDEFVRLKDPFHTRWMEKCNEAHIAALRIIMRSTLSMATVSREFAFQPGSPEVGELMGALLMSAMGKLAATRNTAPTEVAEAEDTVIKLMRGLFGNLLTVAGSGVRPMSMVWQLFGQHPQFDIPDGAKEWLWYQNVVQLYPFTGWPLAQFKQNLGSLLDKAIVRVVTKGEEGSVIREDRVAAMAKYCRLKNIQLEHCRTINTVLRRMLTEDVDRVACASRLLEKLPHKLERQTESFSRLISYLRHLAGGGERRPTDDAVAANVFTRRSAAFAEQKAKIAEACRTESWSTVKKRCQKLKEMHEYVADHWKIPASSLQIQNMAVYDTLRNMAVPNATTVQQERLRIHGWTRQVLSDAEIKRVPWQVGKKGEFGDEIEPLDQGFVEEMLTGVRPEPAQPQIESTAPTAEEAEAATAEGEQEKGDTLENYMEVLQPAFVKDMQERMTAKHVCAMLKIPEETLKVFAKALNPEFSWKNLGPRFRAVIMWLLANRSNRIGSRPVRKLFDLTDE